MIVLALLMAGLQSGTLICSGTEDERNCRSDDGSTYVERRLVDQVVRQGTMPDGSTWTEYLTRVFDGTRLEGSDSNGRRWSQQCNPRFGTTGTDRNGATIFIPPSPRKQAGSADDRSGSVSNAVGSTAPSDEGC